MPITKENEFPSLMKDVEDLIWFVNPPVTEMFSQVFYMVCLGKFQDGIVYRSKAGSIQSVSLSGMKKYEHMPKGFFVEIEQVE